MATTNGVNSRSPPGSKEEIPRDNEELNYVPATNHATTWKSIHSQMFPEDLKLMSHVNCSYFSGDQAPTLLELKKHAQSLAILIRKLSLQTNFGVPDAEANGERGTSHWMSFRFRVNEAFDWLNDLSAAYENEDAYHHLPLKGLKNEIKSENDVSGVVHHCPLPHQSRDPGSNIALLEHANECLEILDHEYSAAGGLLALLPTGDEDSEEMKHARNTLLGQWLYHQHHLVGRMHELEIEYANALSALSSEAEIPKQIISKQTFEERGQGWDVASLQDQFILVNAGTPAHNEIHRLLDEKEKTLEERARQWHDAGVMGSRLSNFRNGNDIDEEEPVANGLVQIDLVSRFYRVKGDGPNAAIFILPAIHDRDTVKRTSEMEKNPGIVSVPMSKWPSRVTDWERKYREKIHKADISTDWAPTVQRLREENEELKEELRVMRAREMGSYPHSGTGRGFMP